MHTRSESNKLGPSASFASSVGASDGTSAAVDSSIPSGPRPPVATLIDTRTTPDSPRSRHQSKLLMPLTSNGAGISLGGDASERGASLDAPIPHGPIVATASQSLASEMLASTEVLLDSPLTVLLVLGPIAIVGDATEVLGEAACFACAGIALIPCAERLSFVTEQVAQHTNGTIGALLNATFGNAPELLISTAALKAGFYRVVQLAMLGSMITNMVFVFGASCLIGGLRWQVQHLRLVSGNVSVGMLLVATAGSLIPATLILSGQFPTVPAHGSGASSSSISNGARQLAYEFEAPTHEEVTLSRVNAVVMLVLYLCYVVFQLGTHKEEFEDDFGETMDDSLQQVQSNRSFHHAMPAAQPNIFCRGIWYRIKALLGSARESHLVDSPSTIRPRGIKKNLSDRYGVVKSSEHDSHNSVSGRQEEDEEIAGLIPSIAGRANASHEDSTGSVDVLPLSSSSDHVQRRRRGNVHRVPLVGVKSKRSDAEDDHNIIHRSMQGESFSSINMGSLHHPPPLISMRVGLMWLFIITLCISAMSDILVDTIDGFAQRMQLSQVFTSMVIVPFFSNVAEQVSAFLFAYRNEMDLCVGVTIGSAIQIATLVLPGSVLIGAVLDRSMTLYFRSYETACLFFCTVTVAAVLQGGTTNWLVGAMLVGVYIMFAAGIWFHEIENLSIDAQVLIDTTYNTTGI